MYWLFVLLALLSGVLSSLQGGANSALGRRIGLWEGVFVCMFSGAIFLGIAVLTGLTGGDITRVTEVPLFKVIMSGAIGMIPPMFVMLASPKIGIASCMIWQMTGQLLFAILIDQFGLFGVAKISVDPYRIIGVLLVLSGAVIMYSGNPKKAAKGE